MTAFLVVHGALIKPALGRRVDEQGHSVVLSARRTRIDVADRVSVRR